MKSKLWFEKTVEYAFIRKCPDFFACPLDGNMERMGDTIFARDAKFLLVEFKKQCNQNAVKIEKEKYSDWNTASGKLGEIKSNTCHWVVFGDLENDHFVLKKIHYLNFMKCTGSCDCAESIEDEGTIFESGTELNKFQEYLEAVVKAKLENKESSGGGNNATALSLDNTLIINDKGDAFSIAEVVACEKLQKALKLTINSNPNAEHTPKNAHPEHSGRPRM